ncbi:thiamine phosphate synthase [Candidatus Margulisiibacteriota bacterium]
MSRQRILDANSNRLKEGLRVIEDVVRFVFDDKRLAKKVRKIRRSVCFSKEEYLKIIEERDVKRDVGRKSDISTKNIFEAVVANFKRIQEAARSLEEFSDDKKLYKKIRFEAYALERTILRRWMMMSRHQLKKNPWDGEIMVITDSLKKARFTLRRGCKVIELRDKKSIKKKVLKKAKQFRKLTRRYKAYLIINDYLDIALLSDADGVHLGQYEIPIQEARKILGEGKIVGRTTHSYRQARGAEKEGADYVGFGPLYKTPTKPDYKPIGLRGIKKVVKKLKIPVFCIGGINESTVDDVINAGGRNVAVVRGYRKVKEIKGFLVK